MSKELISLQERLAHLERANEEMSDIIRELSLRLDRAEKRVEMLMDHARADGDGGGSVVIGERPPHY